MHECHMNMSILYICINLSIIIDKFEICIFKLLYNAGMQIWNMCTPSSDTGRLIRFLTCNLENNSLQEK